MWQQLKRSKLFLSGAGLCALLVIIGTLGYAITADPTPNANQIVPEWSNLSPGTTVYYSQQQPLNADATQNLGSTNTSENTQTTQKTPTLLFWAIGEPNTPKIVPFTADPIANPDGNPTNNPAANPGRGLSAPDSTKMVDGVFHHRTFWLGSDRFGRDILSRMIIGARISLSIGFLAMIASLVIGSLIGLCAGYFGGRIDAFFSWLITVFWSVPTLLIALGLSMLLGKGYYQVLLATALSTWVEVARVVRGQTLQLKQREFILAAKITGFSNSRIMFKHILPNLKGPLTVLATTNFASAILLEAGLGFLGLGVTPPTPSWGMMVKENLGYLVLDNSYLALIPGIAIMILVMAFNLMSMGLRDALDPYNQK
jgi:peptide/nickel transport system permease protein